MPKAVIGHRTAALTAWLHRTLKLLGLDPINTMVTALKEYVRTGSLPPLPAAGPRDPP